MGLGRCVAAGRARSTFRISNCFRGALLMHRAEVDALDDRGETPLAVAVRMWNATLAELLVDHGADIHRKVEVPGQGSLTLLELAREKQDAMMIELLLERGTGTPKSIDEDKLPVPSKSNPFISLIMNGEYYALKWASPVGDIEVTSMASLTACFALPFISSS